MWGGGLDATNMKIFGAGTSLEKCSERSPFRTIADICASSNACCTAGKPISGETVTSTPKAPPIIMFAVVRSFVMPAIANVSNSLLEKKNASGSPFWYSTVISRATERFNSAKLESNIEAFSALNLRHSVIFSSFAVRSRASAASFSSLAARSVASSTRLFDRFRSSVWICCPTYQTLPRRQRLARSLYQ